MFWRKHLELEWINGGGGILVRYVNHDFDRFSYRDFLIGENLFRSHVDSVDKDLHKFEMEIIEKVEEKPN